MLRSEISDPIIRPTFTVLRIASRFITGSAPGSPRHTGQTVVFGSPSVCAGHAQNIFVRVFNCTCTSSPMEGI